MSVFGGFGILRSAFLGLERQRKSEGVPKWSVFGAVFAIFGAFFAKSGLFFAKNERNGEVLGDFEKGRRAIALFGKLLPFALFYKDLQQKFRLD